MWYSSSLFCLFVSAASWRTLTLALALALKPTCGRSVKSVAVDIFLLLELFILWK